MLLAGCRRGVEPVRAEFRVAVWQWHAPFGVVDRGLPVDEVYVRAATLSYDGDRLVAILPQRFERGGAWPVSLVLNFDAGAVRHFEELSLDAIRELVVGTYQSAAGAARKQGIEVRGLQLDLDCPVRLLPRYAELCRGVKRGLGKDRLSVTGLVSWIDDARVRELMQAVDLFVPQFYEGRLPRRFEDDVPVSDARDFSKYVRKLRNLGGPYQVGVAAYGQALLFDGKGGLVGPYRGLSLADAFRHPSLSFLGLDKVEGELHARFRANRPDARGRGKGYGILFRVPTAESLGTALAIVRREKSENCAGFAVFRLPEEGEGSTLPVSTLASVLKGKGVEPKIRLESRSRANPYAMIEGEARAAAEDVRVAISNQGDAPRLAEDPIEVEVRYPVGCAEVVAPGVADRVVRLDAAGAPMNGSLPRTAGIRFERRFVGVGETVELGAVRLGAGCRGEVRIR